MTCAHLNVVDLRSRLRRPLSALLGRPGRLRGARYRPLRLAPESGHDGTRPEADMRPSLALRGRLRSYSIRLKASLRPAITG